MRWNANGNGFKFLLKQFFIGELGIILINVPLFGLRGFNHCNQKTFIGFVIHRLPKHNTFESIFLNVFGFVGKRN